MFMRARSWMPLGRVARADGRRPKDSRTRSGRGSEDGGRRGATGPDRWRSRPDPRVVRVEQGSGAGYCDGDWVLLAEVLDEELRADDGLLGREVGHEEVLADRGAGAGRGHVGAAAVGVGERGAGAGEDRLATEHVALDAALGGRVVAGEGAQDGGGAGAALLEGDRPAYGVRVLDRG